MEASHKLSEQMYAQSQEDEAAAGDASTADDNVVDAEFEEVDENNSDEDKRRPLRHVFERFGCFGGLARRYRIEAMSYGGAHDR